MNVAGFWGGLSFLLSDAWLFPPLLLRPPVLSGPPSGPHLALPTRKPCPHTQSHGELGLQHRSFEGYLSVHGTASSVQLIRVQIKHIKSERIIDFTTFRKNSESYWKNPVIFNQCRRIVAKSLLSVISRTVPLLCKVLYYE